jgi:hypothetical protein
MRLFKSIGLATLGTVALLGFGLSQTAAAKEPTYSAPYDVEVFVRGSFNNWGLSHEMKFDRVENEYVAYVELTPGGYEFKIASEDWLTVDLGYADDGMVELGVPEPITSVIYSNLYLEVAEAGVYAFRFDVADLDHLTVLVEYARKGGDGTEHYTSYFTDVPYFFDCLGEASPVVTDIAVEGTMHVRVNPPGGAHYRDSVRIDGVGFDQLGREYRMHLISPAFFNGKSKGSFAYSESSRATFIAKDGGPNLYFKYVYKFIVDPTGEVKRDFLFYEDGCR